MANPTANWEKVGSKFYRKIQLYTAVFDQELELENYIVTGCSYGGAIGMLLFSYHPEPNQKDTEMLYSPIPLNGGRCLGIGSKSQNSTRAFKTDLEDRLPTAMMGILKHPALFVIPEDQISQIA